MALKSYGQLGTEAASLNEKPTGTPFIPPDGENNDLSFGWIRRGRVDADSWLGEEIPLGEEREAYQAEIWRSDVLVRSVQVQAAFWPAFGFVSQRLPALRRNGEF